MPVIAHNIPWKDLIKWSYLEKVDVPEIDSNIELLIEANAARVTEPWEVINSQDGGPYAVRTQVGWIINGPLRSAQSRPYNDCYSPTVNRISVAKLETSLIRQYNHDFSENASEEKCEMSMEDKRFLQITNQFHW